MPQDYRKSEMEPEVFDPGKYYSDSAYTTPADFGKQRRYQRKNVLLAMLAVGCVMATIASFVYMLFFYNVVVGPRMNTDSGELPEQHMSGAVSRPNFETDVLSDMSRPQGGMHIEPPGSEAGHMLNVNNDYEYGDALSAKNIYRKCAPSVVSVRGNSADFSDFELGSGIIISEDGYIITTTNIVSDAGYINVRLYGGGEYPAYLVGEDMASGIAVLKIEANNLLPAEFGNFNDMEVGANAVSIGNPVEGSFAITDGVISSLCGKIKYGGYPITVFQTSAQSGSGSSGAPVINEYGQVVGIINTDMADDYELENLTFAVPVNDAKPIVDELLEHGYVSGRPALGLELIDIPLSVSAYYGMPVGIFVEKVYEESDAYDRGIVRGDIIVSINGVKISSKDELNEVKNELEVGDSVSLGVVSKLEVRYVDVLLIDSTEIND